MSLGRHLHCLHHTWQLAPVTVWPQPLAKMPPDSKKKSPAVGGEAKEKRRVLVRKRSPGKKTQAVRGEVAAGSSQIQMQMPMKKDGNKHEIRKKSGPASSPGPAVGGKSAPAVGRAGCRAGPAEECDSYYSSYSDSDYEPPAVGGRVDSRSRRSTLRK